MKRQRGERRDAADRHGPAAGSWTRRLTEGPSPLAAADGVQGEAFLQRFQDNEQTIPTVLMTSRKLPAGVEAPNGRNIVMMRPVNSMIEFKQIIGRGTRLYEGKG